MLYYNKVFSAIAAITFISACATSPAPTVTQVPNFTKSPLINLDVSKIEVVEAYKAPFAAPNIEHLMPYTPADAVQIWVKDRLRASGNNNKLLQVNIIDASVIEQKLPKTGGIAGVFTIDQDRKYEARLEVEIRVYGGKPLSEADTSIIVTRSITLPENASADSRKAAYIQMLNDMMEIVDTKLDKNIHDYLGNYIIFVR